MTLRGRFGASLMYDCLFYWREPVGGQRRMGLHGSTTGEEPVSSLSATFSPSVSVTGKDPALYIIFESDWIMP